MNGKDVGNPDKSSKRVDAFFLHKKHWHTSPKKNRHRGYIYKCMVEFYRIIETLLAIKSPGTRHSGSKEEDFVMVKEGLVCKWLL